MERIESTDHPHDCVPAERYVRAIGKARDQRDAALGLLARERGLDGGWHPELLAEAEAERTAHNAASLDAFDNRPHGQ